MKKKTKQTTNEQTSFNQVQTPTNPEFVSSGLGDIASRITALGQKDPYSFVAGPNALQTQAAQQAGGLTTSPFYGQAGDIFSRVAGSQGSTYAPTMAQGVTLGDAPSVQATDSTGLIGGFLSPYLDKVRSTSLADFDVNAQQQRAQDMLTLGGMDDTFGGSNGAITLSKTADALARARGSLDAGILDRGWQSALSAAQAEAARRDQAALASAGFQQQRNLAQGGFDQQTGMFNAGASNEAGQFNASARDAALQRALSAGQGLAGIGQAQGADQRANIGLAGDLGAQLQALEQVRAQSPLSLLGTEASLWGGLPLGLLHGQNASGDSTTNSTTKTTVSDPMGSIGGLLSGAGSLALGLGTMGLGFAPSMAGMGAIVSDRRAKTDIEKVGEMKDGLGVYRYRYKAGGPTHIGVMAQEVQKKKPEAVVKTSGGLLAVDYGAL